MRHTIGIASNILIVASLAITGAAVFVQHGAARAPLEGPALQVDAPTKSFGVAWENREVPVVFTLSNSGAYPIRIVGSTNICMSSACLTAAHLPIVIPAEESRRVTIMVTTKDPGDFSGSITLYTDREGERDLVLRVEGEVVGTAKPAS